MLVSEDSGQNKQRQFICPCAKSYYSYAALFTHIKQKHQGKAPGPITKPPSENKRGRPRKSTCPLLPSLVSHHSHQPMFPEPNRSLGSDLKWSPGSQFKTYKRDPSSTTTCPEQPKRHCLQAEATQQLTRCLGEGQLDQTPAKITEDLVSHQILHQQSAPLMVRLRRFLGMAKEGLQDSAYSQVELLVTMLLQHAMDATGEEEVKDWGSEKLLKHVPSFFDYIAVSSRQAGWAPLAILQQATVLRVLLVLFNWLCRVEVNPDEPAECNDLLQ